MIGPGNDAPAPLPEGRTRWQFGLRAMLAVTALVAVWTAHLNNRREIRRLEGRIQSLVPLVPELTVVDPTQFAVVKLEALWYDENRWDVYIPEGAFRLRLATRGIDTPGLPADSRSAPIPPGPHSLELRQEEAEDGWRISLLVDGSSRVDVVEPKNWFPGAGTATSERGGGVSDQAPTTEPFILFRRHFYGRDESGGSAPLKEPGPGILIGIERDAPGAQGVGGDRSKTPTGLDDSSSASSAPTSYFQ